MQALLAGEVAWYATGRFFTPDGQLPFDAGYFLYLAGVAGELFAGEPSETTARFTFCAEPISSRPVPNGGLSLVLDRVGKFSIYLQQDPAGNFDNPYAFAAGTRIATLQRRSAVVGAGAQTGVVGNQPFGVSANVFSAEVIWSQPFEFNGQLYDLAEMFPFGITQWGVATSQPLAPPPKYSEVVPFLGSAVVVGGPVRA